MATITEDYVSFEVAKLLKEKGFNEKLLTFYITDEAKKEGCFQIMAFTDDKIDNNHSDQCYLAPTLQMTIKWLREVHKKWITITFHWHTVDGETTLCYSPFIMLGEGEYVVLEDENPFKMKPFNSYEEACEVAIKYCLENLI